MEKFFLEHHVMKDRDKDDLNKRCNSDSEASENEEYDVRVHSVMDKTGPWRQTPVDSMWGQARAGNSSTSKRYQKSVHTGPKGVIHDFKVHKKYQREEENRKEQEREAIINRIAKGATISSHQGATSQNVSECDCECDNDSECCCDELVDDDYFTQYRAMRMREIHNKAAKTHPNSLFGILEFVSPNQFVDAINKSDEKVFSLVHLYHPDNYSCGLLNQLLAVIAGEHQQVQFMSMIAKDADNTIHMEDLPLMMIYRGSSYVETIINISDEIDGEFTKDRIESLLRDHLLLLP